MKVGNMFKNFDIHPKALEGVTQQTTMGAIVTLVAAFTVLVLMISEIRIYTTTDLVSRMYPDNGIGKSEETIKLFFDVEFPEVDCSVIKFAQEVTRGSVHVHEADHDTDIQREQMINPERPGKFGCWIHGSVVTDRVGGHFIFKVDPTQRTMTEEERIRERNTNPSKAMPGMTKDVIPPLHHKVNHVMFLPASGPGSDKKEALQKKRDDSSSSSSSSSKRIRDASVRGLLKSDSKFGLDLEKTLLDLRVTVDPSKGLHQYMLQVVPTHYKSRKGPRHDQQLNQYSVTSKSVDAALIAQGATIPFNGQALSGTYGVVFAYDFYPVVLTVEERKESFVEFLANLVGIVGGVITTINLVEKTVSSGVKTLIGKKD